MQGINIEEVKQYNANLKQYQDKASQVKAGIDYSKKELDRLCAELSSELGQEVTPENIRSIRDERLKKIQNTLEVGKEILGRIKKEEEMANSVPTVQTTNPMQSAVVQTPMQAPVQAPVQTPMQAPVQAPVQAPIFGATQAPQAPQTPDSSLFGNLGDIPSIFAK